MKEEKINSFEMAKKQIDIAAKHLDEVLDISISKKIPMRTAALVLGIGRVAEATKLRGIYP
jgi:glutamate dehydrogenase/leucine dehydrogenase